MNIALKNVPDKVDRTIASGQTVHPLELEPVHLERRRSLPQLIEKLNRFAAPLPPMDDNT
jgi:hypothetical protein